MKEYNDKKYKFGRAISALVVNTTLKPQMFGLNKIPKEGPIIFCGNHLHVWDQYPVMCATKHTIHWLAKKEYFEGKLGPVFSFMGCIEVDRQNNPHASKQEAIEYLKAGSNIGLFPEGTRNCLKGNDIKTAYDFLSKYGEDVNSFEEFAQDVSVYQPRLSQVNVIRNLVDNKVIDAHFMYNHLLKADVFLRNLFSMQVIDEKTYQDSLLLPFRYGAVSMAQQTDAKIVPFAVTGKYKIGNDDLMVNFGEPFKVGESSIESANNELKAKVLKLLLENYER